MYFTLQFKRDTTFKKNSKLIDNSGCSPQLEGFDAGAIELDKSIALCEHKCFLVARFHES